MNRFTDQDNWRWYANSEEDYHAGRACISVTTVLDCVTHQRLQQWQVNNSKAKIEQTLKESSDIGAALHELVEKDLKMELSGEVIDAAVPSILLPIFSKWRRLKQEHKISALSTELGVAHPRYGYAGTLDILGYYDNQLCVMDIKTGTYGVKAGWQMAAYRQALIDNAHSPQYGQQGIGLVGLSVPRRTDREPIAFKYQHVDPCWLAFLSTMNSWRMLYWNKLKRMNWMYLDTPLIQEAPSETKSD